MRSFLKFVAVCLLVVFVGLPALFLVLTVGGAIFGVTLGILGMIAGLVVTIVKIGLFVLLPILVVGWLLKKVFARRDYV